MIDKKNFFERVRESLFGGELSQSQVDGMNAILDEWESKYPFKDIRFLAYALATVFHECDKKMQPISEYRAKAGTKARANQDRYWLSGFYGRGFVQLTWERNYRAMSEFVGADLVNHPERALELPIATKVLFEGMMRGTFTSKKLSDYISGEKADWRNARKIINGLDKADLIASYAKKFDAAISVI